MLSQDLFTLYNKINKTIKSNEDWPRFIYFDDFLEAYIQKWDKRKNPNPDISPIEFQAYNPARYNELFTLDYLANDTPIVHLFKIFLDEALPILSYRIYR